MDELKDVWPESGPGQFSEMRKVFDEEEEPGAPSGRVADKYGLMSYAGSRCYLAWLPESQVRGHDLLWALDPPEYQRVTRSWQSWARRRLGAVGILNVEDVDLSRRRARERGGVSGTPMELIDETQILEKLGLTPATAREKCCGMIPRPPLDTSGRLVIHLRCE